jgi:hypothetical protein
VRKTEIAEENENRFVVDDRRERRESHAATRNQRLEWKSAGQVSKLPPKNTNRDQSIC